MGRTPRNSKNGIVRLARELEAAESELRAAQQRVAVLQRRMLARIDAPAAAPPNATKSNRAPIRRARPSRREIDWKAVKTALLSAMKTGAMYSGAELPKLARTTVSDSRFIANVRGPLLSGKAIKKVTVDGKPWRKGMSPRSARWMKSS